MERTSRPALRLYLRFFGFTLLALLLLRLAFFLFALRQAPESLSFAPAKDLAKALYIGLRFDARIAALFTLPLGLILSVPRLGRRLSVWADKIFFIYFALFLLLWGVYVADFGFYSYLGVRLNATIIDLLEDLQVAVNMVLESYHVVPIACGLLAATAGSALIFRRIAKTPVKTRAWGLKSLAAWLCGFIIFALAAYGQLSSNLFPLRWSNAYFSANQAVSSLALNPVQNFYDTYRGSQGHEFSVKKARSAYTMMADFLKVDRPDDTRLDYSRKVTPPARPLGARAPNVVIIIMESLAFPKTSFAPGNDDPTPELAALARESMLYTRFFANARTTARAVFTAMTGIPDVTESSTGSRNPFVVDQFVVGDQFKGYEKFYMLGGNTAWANIRGVLANNVHGLRILEENAWQAKNVDVWGISDWDLLHEAHKVFLEQGDKPFWAVIQTASFHRPYTVPDTPGFKRRPLSDETKANYGFTGEDEYNSLRYTDHCLGEFFRLAKKSPYYANTIFFVLGDHGLNDKSANMPDSYKAAGLMAWHVPLLIHAPGLLRPGVSAMPCSTVDLFPTAAWMAGIPYENRTLGRSLFDERYNNSRAVYICGQDPTPIHLIQGDYCFYDNRVGVKALYNITESPAVDHSKTNPELFRKMGALAGAMHETAHYMLFNNKKDK